MTRRYTARVEITPLKKGETLWLAFDSDGTPHAGHVLTMTNDSIGVLLKARGGPRVVREKAKKGAA